MQPAPPYTVATERVGTKTTTGAGAGDGAELGAGRRTPPRHRLAAARHLPRVSGGGGRRQSSARTRPRTPGRGHRGA